MVREIYERRFGNPILPEALPNAPLELELPAKPIPAAQVGPLCWAVIVTALKAVIVTGLLAQVLYWLGWLDIPVAVGLLVFAGLSPHRLPFLLTLAAALAVCPPLLPLMITILGPYIACLFFALDFTLHHVYVATAFPVPFATGSFLRRLCALFLASPLPGLALVPLTILCAPVALLLAPRRALRGYLSAWHAWLTYDYDVTPAPGVLKTPLGSLGRRQALLFVTVGLTSAYVGLPSVRYAITREMGPFSAITPAPATESLRHYTPLHGLPVTEALEAHDPHESNRLPHYVRAFIAWLVQLGVPFLGGLILILLTTLATAAPIGAFLDLSCRRYRVPTPPQHEQHRMIVERLRNSTNPIERRSLFAGLNLQDGSPFFPPASLFNSHAWLLGGSGGGKTSALADYIEQLTGLGNCSVVLIDLKADTLELLQSLVAAAQRARATTGMALPLKWFSNREGDSTFAFSPFLQPCWKSLSLQQQADFLGTATATTYSQSYGEAYYSAASLHALRTALQEYPRVPSLRELATTLDELLTGRRKNSLPNKLRSDATHVQMKLLQLAELEGLNVTPDSNYPPDVLAHAIDLSALFQQPQLVYFGLPCAIGPSSSPDIARLVIYSLMLTAASLRHRPVQVYLVIDEFQRCVATNLEFVLQTARSMGIGCILANQSMQDLQQGSINLLPAMESCTTFRQYFRISSLEDMQRLVAVSGKGVDYLYGLARQESGQGVQMSLTKQQYLTEFLSTNDVNLASANTRHSIVLCTQDAGYAAYGGFPFVVESLHHISPQEYERRKASSWPGHTLGTLTQRSAPPPPPGGSSGAPLAGPPPQPSPIVGIQTIHPPSGKKGNQTNPPSSRGSQRRRRHP